MNSTLEEVPQAFSRMDAIVAITLLKDFIGKSQLAAIKQGMVGEEKQYFFDKMVEIACLVGVMDSTYDQNGKGDDAIAWLHYFKGGCDWWITEKDKGDPDTPGQHQAFGWADLNDPQNAELGYISINELLQCGVELDMHWEPRPLSKVKERYAEKGGD